MSPKEIRAQLGVPLIRAAVDAGAAEATVRIYEADRTAVSTAKRAALDAYYQHLSDRLTARDAR